MTRAAGRRAKHLDGLRAVAMLAICWDHWRPEGWPRVFPFEIFLFFFLVMTGFFVTSSLLRERDAGEVAGEPWKWRAMKIYQVRRGLRILAPYYAALLVAAAVVAPDVWRAPLAYVLHVSNIHIAWLGAWPHGTNHFWSLAMQQQFYLIWPFVIWWTPRRALPWVILLIAAIGPAARYLHDDIALWLGCPWPQTLTWASLDYFGLGAFFAWSKWRGLSLDSALLKVLPLAGLAGYLFVFATHSIGRDTYGLRCLQQTFLSIALCGLIAWALRGFPGWIGRILENRWLQAVGEKSYGVYLYHNFAPLIAGKVFFFLWFPPFSGTPAFCLRLVSYAFLTWLFTRLSWQWIEGPLQKVREGMGR